MKNTSDLESYYTNLSEPVRHKLQEIRNLVYSTIPANELRECIKYGIPTFVYRNKNLLHIGGFTQHVSIFPGAKAVAFFSDSFKKHTMSKGTIQFRLDEELPFDKIKEVILFCRIEWDKKSSKS